MKTFGGPFGDSPLQPLYEHYLKIEAGARMLPEYLENFSKGVFTPLDRITAEIKALEEEADLIKDETRKRLSTSIFAAVQRADIIQYLSTQDDIADHYTSIVSILSMRRTPIPAELVPMMQELCSSCLAVVFRLGEVFRAIIAKEGEARVDDLLAALPHIEHKASATEEKFLVMLFAEEGIIDPISVILLMRVAEDMMNMAKRARNASDILQRLLK
ncbi:MAG: DUF47 family protein [Candidatus Brocadiia bacterium]